MTRARDALAAERRRMPWLAVEKKYEFEGPKGKASLRDLFEGRHQLIVYRAFYEPGVFGWPDHACRGCSMVADQVAHVAHLNARDTTLVFVSRAPQADIARLKARMGWEMIPWYTVTDSFDADFGVGEWHGTNVFFRDGDKIFRTYFINNRGDEQMGGTWNYLDITPLGRQEEWEDSPEGYPQTPTYKWWNWHDSYVEGAAPDKRWVEVSDAGEAAFREAVREREAVSQACSGGSEGGAIRWSAAARRAANWLYLAAAPTFAIMALLTGVLGGGPPDALCSTASASPLGGMVPMYLLMSVFHLAPWLKLIASRAGAVRSGLRLLPAPR